MHRCRAPSPPRGPRPGSRRAAEAGFSLLEGMIGMALVAVALLAHASTTLSEERLGREQQVRSEGLILLEQFVERLRSDEDWAALHARLLALQVAADTPAAGAPTFEDGRAAHAPGTYFPDFALVGDLDAVGFLVDVPAAPLDEDPTGPAHLREDLAQPRFGLPADLNGDGAVDGASRDADYAVLPVVVRMRWVPHGEASREVRLGVWLRGDR